MCKELKRLILLADCAHLNKTDRDSIQWAIQNLSPEQAETETSFGGWDFQSWPSVPDKRVFEDLIKSRRAKRGCIMTQTYIDKIAPHLHALSKKGLTVNESLAPAVVGGWTGFNPEHVMNELGVQDSIQGGKPKTPDEAIKMINNKQITSFKLIDTHIKRLIETQFRLVNYNPETMANLERAGLVL